MLPVPIYRCFQSPIFRSVFWTVLLLIAGFYEAEAQQHRGRKLRSANLVLETRAYYGWTLDHHIEMTVFRRHYPAFEVSIQKATYGRTRWEYMYNYPFIGLACWYSGLGGTKPLGSAIAVFPYINFPLLRTENFNLYFRTGAGLGYLTRRYDRYENYENIAIGSHLNAMASAGLSLVHFSNGAIRQPNYGLNMPGATVSLAYRLSRENPYLRQKLLPRLKPFEYDGKKFVQLDLNLAFGVKDYQSTLGRGNLYLVAAAYGNLMWPVSYKSRLGFGADVSFDGSDKTLLELRGVIPEHKIDLLRTGINAAYEMSFSRMSFMMNLGFYLTGLDKRDGYLYEKVGIRYYINNQIFTGLTLKAHYARADYLTLGLGYRIPIKYY